MQSFLILLQYTLIFTSVLSIVALGGMFSERSGVINLGLEGCMVIGALFGALFLRYFPNLSPFLTVFLSIIVSIIGGILYSLLLAIASITFKADQTISGTALNIMSAPLATVIVKAITLKEEGKSTPYLYYITQFGYYNFTINFGEYSLTLNWFVIIMFLLVLLSFVILRKTRFGLRLMSCGELPQASASVGIDVIKERYIGVMISGALAGLGGFAYILSVSSWPFNSGVDGFGFLALAVMIFGKWKPLNILLGGLLFGFFRALGSTYFGFDFLVNSGIDSRIYVMLPYIICLVVLIVTSKNSRAPKAEGIPYDPGQR